MRLRGTGGKRLTPELRLRLLIAMQLGCTLAELGERLPAIEYPLWDAIFEELYGGSGSRSTNVRGGTRGVMRDAKAIETYFQHLADL